MTTEEGATASRRSKLSIMSPKSINEGGPGRVDVPYCAGPITWKYMQVENTDVVTSHWNCR